MPDLGRPTRLLVQDPARQLPSRPRTTLPTQCLPLTAGLLLLTALPPLPMGSALPPIRAQTEQSRGEIMT